MLKLFYVDLLKTLRKWELVTQGDSESLWLWHMSGVFTNLNQGGIADRSLLNRAVGSTGWNWACFLQQKGAEHSGQLQPTCLLEHSIPLPRYMWVQSRQCTEEAQS